MEITTFLATNRSLIHLFLLADYVSSCYLAIYSRFWRCYSRFWRFIRDFGGVIRDSRNLFAISRFTHGDALLELFSLFPGLNFSRLTPRVSLFNYFFCRIFQPPVETIVRSKLGGFYERLPNRTANL